MRHEFDFILPPPGPALRLAFSWDDETGTLSGENTDVVRAWAAEAASEGIIICDELDGMIPATDPLHNKSEFCALIGRDKLPESLKDFFPTPDYPGFELFGSGESDVFTPVIDVVY